MRGPLRSNPITKRCAILNEYGRVDGARTVGRRNAKLANRTIPAKMVPGMSGAMDLVSGAKSVVIAMQHTSRGKSKIVPRCELPITSLRRIDLLVTAQLLETAPGVSVADVLAATGAELDVSGNIPEMAL